MLRIVAQEYAFAIGKSPGQLSLCQSLAHAPCGSLASLLGWVLRSYGDFRDTTREAESYEKYRADLLPWWKALTEGFTRCRLVVEQTQRRLDDVVTWMAQAISPMLAVIVASRGYDFLVELIYAGKQRWRQKHHALLKEPPPGGTPYVLHLTSR